MVPDHYLSFKYTLHSQFISLDTTFKDLDLKVVSDEKEGR